MHQSVKNRTNTLVKAIGPLSYQSLQCLIKRISDTSRERAIKQIDEGLSRSTITTHSGNVRAAICIRKMESTQQCHCTATCNVRGRRLVCRITGPSKVRFTFQVLHGQHGRVWLEVYLLSNQRLSNNAAACTCASLGSRQRRLST